MCSDANIRTGVPKLAFKAIRSYRIHMHTACTTNQILCACHFSRTPRPWRRPAMPRTDGRPPRARPRKSRWTIGWIRAGCEHHPCVKKNKSSKGGPRFVSRRCTRGRWRWIHSCMDSFRAKTCGLRCITWIGCLCVRTRCARCMRRR